MSVDLRDDPRWMRFKDKEWACRTCARKHFGLFDLVCDRPIFWAFGAGPSDEAEDPKNFLNEDFCVINREQFFIRCVLQLPIIGGAGASFGYGIWSSLSEENFKQYMGTYESSAQAELGPWFGWFANRLNGYPETSNLKCRVHPQNGRQRPWLELEPTDHPLALDQTNGISFDRVLEIYAINGHDIRDLLAELH